MAITTESLGETLEGRYATDHVGGAYDAKNIQKPRSTEKILADATMGKKPEESLYVEGLNTEKYTRHDEIIPEVKGQPRLEQRGIVPKTVQVGSTLRTPVESKGIVAGQNPRFEAPVSPRVVEGGTSLRTMSTRQAVPGQNPRANSVTPPSVEPGTTLRTSTASNIAVPGQNPRFEHKSPSKASASSGGRTITTGIARKGEPSGAGTVGTPSPMPFRPRLARLFGPIFPGPIPPIYWETDPDMWDLTKLVGPVNWDS